MNSREDRKDMYTIYDDQRKVEADIEIQCENGAIHLVIRDPECPEGSPCGTLGLTMDINRMDGIIRAQLWTDNLIPRPTEKHSFKYSMGCIKPTLRKQKEVTND